MKAIADKIKTETLSLESRGLPSDSYFEVVFTDNSIINEKDHNWRDIAKEQYVVYDNTRKTVLVSRFPIKEITIHHGLLSTTLVAGEGEDIYQNLTSSASYKGGERAEWQIIGRKVGKIKNGKVIEEHYLNGQTNEVIGFKF